MARMKPEHLRELNDLQAISSCMVDLIGQYEDLGESGPQMQVAIDNALTLQNLRGMRTIARDLRAMMAALRPAQRAEIERDVVTRTGLQMALVTGADRTRIARVVKRGRITNEGEYHLLRARIDEISGEVDREGETLQLQALVDAFGG